MRLIDADALRASALKSTNSSDFAFDNCFPYWQFSKCIEQAPTIDAVPMAHGKWVHGKKEKLYYTCEMEGYWEIPVYCSECKYDLEKYGGEESNYCPNCGAKMSIRGGDAIY